MQRFLVLVGLWGFYLVRAELQTAYRLGQQCLHIAQQAPDATLSLEAQAILAVTLFFLGEFPQARSHLEQHIARSYAVQSISSALHTVGLPVVACQAYMAFILWLLGYPAQARRQCQVALTLAWQVAHPYSLAYALSVTGWVQQLLTGGPGIRESAEATRTLAAEHGFPFWEAHGSILLSRTLCHEGQVDAGLATMRHGLQVYQAAGAVLTGPFFSGAPGRGVQPGRRACCQSDGRGRSADTGREYWRVLVGS